MRRAVVNVATTKYYQRGQARLRAAVAPGIMIEWNREPRGCPPHGEVPYAMKAYALKSASEQGYDLLLWADACILPVRSMEPLWERIERDGYWMCRNGYTNYEWTADSAYLDLFEYEINRATIEGKSEWGTITEWNRKIPHVVATTFGINVKHPKGKEFLDEYYRLASETRAFCGPWTNGNKYEGAEGQRQNPRCYPCGPSDVRGHRHDQTAASVIAWRLGFELTDPPDIFAYGRADEPHDERTILLADGSYT